MVDLYSKLQVYADGLAALAQLPRATCKGNSKKSQKQAQTASAAIVATLVHPLSFTHNCCTPPTPCNTPTPAPLAIRLQADRVQRNLLTTTCSQLADELVKHAATSNQVPIPLAATGGAAMSTAERRALVLAIAKVTGSTAGKGGGRGGGGGDKKKARPAPSGGGRQDRGRDKKRSRRQAAAEAAAAAAEEAEEGAGDDEEEEDMATSLLAAASACRLKGSVPDFVSKFETAARACSVRLPRQRDKRLAKRIVREHQQALERSLRLASSGAEVLRNALLLLHAKVRGTL